MRWATARKGHPISPRFGRDGARALRPSQGDAILAVLVGCDLRRAEVVTLRIEDVQLRADHWVTADLIGKVGGPASAGKVTCPIQSV
jgi:integrase